MKKKLKLEELENKAPKDWEPQAGDIYLWKSCATRRGFINMGIIVSYDPEKQITRGRMANKCGDKRYKALIFKYEPIEPLSNQEKVLLQMREEILIYGDIL